MSTQMSHIKAYACRERFPERRTGLHFPQPLGSRPRKHLLSVVCVLRVNFFKCLHSTPKHLRTCVSSMLSCAYFSQVLFERSEFLIPTRGTSQKKNPSVSVCVRLILVLVWKNVLVLVWGTSERLVPAKKKKNAWYQRALRCQLRGRPFHPWAGRLCFSGEAHPGPATLTQRSSFSCGAGLQSESRLLLCCAPVTRDHVTHV